MSYSKNNTVVLNIHSDKTFLNEVLLQIQEVQNKTAIFLLDIGVSICLIRVHNLNDDVEISINKMCSYSETSHNYGVSYFTISMKII